MIDHDKLRRIMASKGVTQNDLAEKIGTTQSNVSKLCTRDCNITTNTLYKLCDTLGVKAEEIRKR